MNRSSLQTLVAAGAALAIGAAAGATLRPSNSAQQSAASTNNAAPPSHVERPAREPMIHADTQEAVKTGAGAKRWLLVLSLVENATPGDMPALIRLAKGDSAMIRMLAARWAELDPKHMFGWIYSEHLLEEGAEGALPGRWILQSVLFEEWVKTDATAAVKVLTDTPDFSRRMDMRMTVANQLMKTDVEAGLRAMNEWSIRNYIPDMKKLAEWAAQNPRRAAEVALEFGGEHVSREALKHVGKAWAEKNPREGLEFAAQLPASQRARLSSSLMENWAARDLSAAIAFASAQDDPMFQAALAQGLVGPWAKKDPAAALAWSQEHLRGEARTEAISGLIKSAAEKSITTAAELVAEMAPGPAQNRACASIFETWFNKGADQRNAAFEWLSQLPDAETRRAAIDRVVWNWGWREPEAVREFVSGPYGYLASRQMIHQVARNQASKNPEAAMEWARSLPADRAEEARQAALEQWLNIRPEGAMDYARKLPPGPEREASVRTALRTVVLSMSRRNPEQALAFLKQFSGADQQMAREIIQTSGIPSEQRRMLEEGLKGR